MKKKLFTMHVKKIFAMHDGKVQAFIVFSPRRIVEVTLFYLEKKYLLLYTMYIKSDERRILSISIEYDKL